MYALLSLLIWLPIGAGFGVLLHAEGLQLADRAGQATLVSRQRFAAFVEVRLRRHPVHEGVEEPPALRLHGGEVASERGQLVGGLAAFGRGIAPVRTHGGQQGALIAHEPGDGLPD